MQIAKRAKATLQNWGQITVRRYDLRFAAYDGTQVPGGDSVLPAPQSGNVAPPAPGVGATDFDLDRRGVDNGFMLPYWEKIDAILGGIDAMKVTREKFLPKFPDEVTEDYNFRIRVAKMTNVFKDIVEDLSSRPFSEEIKTDAISSGMEDFLTDVDGAGSDISMFAAETFYNGISYSIDWIFVDYPKVALDPFGPVRTRAQDQQEGVRPNWAHVRAPNVLEAQIAMIEGKQQLVYMRILEPPADSRGGKEHVRIMQRVGNIASWTLWQKTDVDPSAPTRTKWIVVDEGVFTIGIIPLVPYATGRRNGKTFQYTPMMRDAVDLQIQLYQDESNLNHAKIKTAFPMISANGVKPVMDGTGPTAKPKPVGTGPGSMLYAAPDGKGNAGSYTLLEPAATSLTFLQSDIKATIDNLRELGRQPLTAQSGNITVITAGVAASKGNSAVKSWAILLGLALENAVKITSLWMSETGAADPEIDVFKDFMTDDTKADVTALLDMRQNGDLSLDTLWEELRRRAILSPDFDADDEMAKMLAEGPADPLAPVDPLATEDVPPTGPGNKNVIPIKPVENKPTPLPYKL